MALPAAPVGFAPLAPGGPRPDPVALAGTAGLGLLLFTARLLAVHGRRSTAALGTCCAAAAEALGLAGTAVRPLSAPLRLLVGAAGPGRVQAGACWAAATALAAYAAAALTRVGAHAPVATSRTPPTPRPSSAPRTPTRAGTPPGENRGRIRTRRATARADRPALRCHTPSGDGRHVKTQVRRPRTRTVGRGGAR